MYVPLCDSCKGGDCPTEANLPGMETDVGRGQREPMEGVEKVKGGTKDKQKMVIKEATAKKKEKRG